MMRQYLEQKEKYPDCILFFRLGDFYEMFFEDAVTASEILEITLTSRSKGADAIPMCGVPHHSARNYINRLVTSGHKVAICDQVEDASQTTKLVKRDVVQVITPGLVTDTEMIDARAPRYLMAAVADDAGWGFAYLDVTTGEFRVGEAEDDESMGEELGRIAAHEIVIADPDGGGQPPAWVDKEVSTTLVQAAPSVDAAHKRLAKHFGLRDLGDFELESMGVGFSAAALALNYLETHNKKGLEAVCIPARHVASEVMFIGRTTQRNLELFHTMAGQRKGSLVSLMDMTRTAMGGRELRRRLAYPLLDVEAIAQRHGAVAELVSLGETRRNLRDALRSVADVERLTGKVAMTSANARDLVALRRSLEAIGELGGLAATLEDPYLVQWVEALDPLPEVAGLLARAIADEPPALITEGGIIREGFDAEIDQLREIQKGGRSWIAELQAGEREKTGINSLKIGFNKVFGYYIEVSRARLEQVPEDYERKQTLANAERYITPELKEMEAKVLGAEERCRVMELNLFIELRGRVGEFVARLRGTATAVAVVDVVAALAELAVQNRYVRPHVHSGAQLEIVGGRHPVVEAVDTGERFVPNDVRFGEVADRLLVITGPNMSGKSTILRQTALMVLMAQMGSFIPAESASIGVVDRVFTRVGASDDLARGHSTFMVEMMEAATILTNATKRSLVILDELGRGTSTFDGLAIAWAVAEYIHDLGARTLFATHYHELTDLARTLKGIKNYNVAVKQWQGNIIFLRRLVEGGVSRSYGIEVAKLAGLPQKVTDRAREVLGNLESGELDERGVPKFAHSATRKPEVANRQLDLFLGVDNTRRDKVLDELSRLRTDNLSPLEALLSLDGLSKEARRVLAVEGEFEGEEEESDD